MADKKFTSLRKRLDQLGYRQALGIESVPLVEKLFSDLVHTTESLRNAKVQLSRQEKDKTLKEDSSEPYRSDNAKLVKENSELHMQLIKQKEDFEETIRGLKATVRKLEHENADLKFLNTQYVHKVKALERDSRTKTEKIQELQEKNLKAVVETPGGRKKQIPFRRQRMDLDSVVPPAEPGASSNLPASVEDPYVADLLTVADKRIEEMQEDLRRLQDEKEATERRNKSLRKQVDHRDKEIDRLNKMLEGGRPVEAVLADTKRTSGDRVVAHLNVQVDYLQQANKELEKKLKDAVDAKREAHKRMADIEDKNLELLAQLKDKDKLQRSLSKEKESAIDSVKRKLEDTEAETRTLVRQVDDTTEELIEVRKERQRLMDEIDRLASHLSKAEKDVQHLSGLLEKSDKEKRRLGDRNDQLTMAERELVMELERLKLAKTSPEKKTRSKSPSRVESLVKTLEKERDYYKNETQNLQDLMRKKLTGSSLSASPKRKTKAQSHLESMLKCMEDERDFYKREYEIIRSQKDRGSPTRSPPTRDRVKDSPSEVSRLRRERDELQSMLGKFERHLAEIQENVKALTSERDNIQLLYEQATEEIQRLRRQAARSRSPSPSRATTAVLARIEAERDQAVADLRRATADVDNIESKLKTAQEAAFSERHRLEDKIEHLETMLEKVEGDRNEMHGRVKSQREMISNLEDQLKSTSSSLTIMRNENAEKDSDINKLKLRIDQTETSVEDFRRQTSRRGEELRDTQEKNTKLEEQNDLLSQTVEGLREEVVQLRGTIKQLDIEKDSLQQQVDVKTEEVVSLEAKRVQGQRAENDLKVNMEDLEARLSHAMDQVSLKDREIRNVQKQIEVRDDDLAEVSRNRDIVNRDNKRLQEDLATMTAENQAIHKELQEALEEQETLKIQISDYASQVARVEELLALKDREKEDILDQYKTLTSEAERLVSDARHSASEVSNYRLELRKKEQDHHELRERLRKLEGDVELKQASEQAYEMQLSSLTRSLSQMEEQLRQANEERESLLQDLAAVRELCLKLDHTRESLQRQLMAKTMDREQLQELLDDQRRETDALRKQVSSERDAVRSLEGLISSQREKSYEEQKSREMTLEEVERLRDKLSRSDKERQSQRDEVKVLRKSSDRLEKEVERLKHELIQAKYEREIDKRLGRSALDSVSKEATSPLTTLTSRYTRSPERGLYSSSADIIPRGRSSPVASDSDISERPLSPLHRRDDDYSDASQ